MSYFAVRKPLHLESRVPVDLSYTSIIPEDGNETERPLVILHGLFGSKRNWGSISKALHRHMPNRPIYALDLRNHGSSPHVLPMTYEAMASDVHKFIADKKLKDVALLGHSMGGKVAMAYALSLKYRDAPPETLSQLVVADIAPSIGSLSPDFIKYISAMQKIESLPTGTIKTRTDADHYLKHYESDLSVRQFLLTNLKVPVHARTDHDGGHEKAKFIVPLDILSSSIPNLGSFPYQYNAEDNSVPTTWTGPTLAIKGIKSPYINRKNLPAFHAFFPNMRLEELDTGHWVHAEKPTEFRKLVVNFLQGS
ncbi:mitochondrial protein [Gymnopilus junonius]|uniref:Mitochondrial protein n=1 Tax=Gymnopilus junonius TaxID=109634 RepID=A0A9P5NP45_GYMJU|nr:mitochondrial protein [Gymnopilus junonius]